MDVHSVGVAAAASRERFALVASRPRTFVRVADKRRRPRRGARRGVELFVVVALDDFAGVVMARGLRGERHHQHSTERKVRSHEDPGVALFDERRDLVQIVARESGCADDDVNAMLNTPNDIVFDGLGGRELNRNLGPRVRQPAQIVAAAYPGDEVKLIVGVNGPAYLSAHSPGVSDNADSNHAASNAS
jgi:hypothetical protein